MIEYRQWIQRNFPATLGPSGSRISTQLELAGVNSDSPSPPEERRCSKPRVWELGENRKKNHGLESNKTKKNSEKNLKKIKTNL